MAIGGSKQSRDDWKSGREKLEILPPPRSLLQEIASEPILQYTCMCQIVNSHKKIMIILIILL